MKYFPSCCAICYKNSKKIFVTTKISLNHNLKTFSKYTYKIKYYCRDYKIFCFILVEQKPEKLEAKPKSTIIPLPTVTKTRKKKEKTSHGCPICGFQGKSRIELNKHLSKAHNLIPPFKCNHVEKGKIILKNLNIFYTV